MPTNGEAGWEEDYFKRVRGSLQEGHFKRVTSRGSLQEGHFRRVTSSTTSHTEDARDASRSGTLGKKIDRFFLMSEFGFEEHRGNVRKKR
jgi:hypothetical protein